MDATKIPLRKRMALTLFEKKRRIITRQHELSYLLWECTLRCNLSCRHCGSDCRKESGTKDMPVADFLKVIDSITHHVNPNRTMIVLTGGEPLMRRDLETCGHELYRRGYPWGIVSNGLALNPGRLESLLDAGLHAVTISLDGPEEYHNRMRGHKDSFSNAYRAIEELSRWKEELLYDVVTCVTPDTFPILDTIKELLIKAGAGRWRIFTVFPIGRASEADQLQLSPVQFRQLFEYIKEVRREGRIELNYGCEGFLGNYEAEVRNNFFFCRAGVTIGSVLADGSISACPNMRGKYIQGNIYKDDFMDVWNNRFQVHRDRSWTRTGECRDCKHFRYCNGNGLHLRDEEGKLMFCHLNRIRDGETTLKKLQQ